MGGIKDTHLLFVCKLGNFKFATTMFNPFHAFPGPGPGILILITMPIPDRVRASLQLIG